MSCRAVLLAIFTLSLGCGSPPASAPTPAPPLPRAIEVVTEWTANGINTGPTTVGQSVTFTGGPFDQLRFRFLVPTGGEPATGALFLLTREYLGSQHELGPQTPGFVASTSRIEDGEWVFDPSLRITASKYWFMANSDMRVFTTPGSQDLYPGGAAYTAGLSGPFTLFTPTN